MSLPIPFHSEVNRGTARGVSPRISSEDLQRATSAAGQISRHAIAIQGPKPENRDNTATPRHQVARRIIADQAAAALNKPHATANDPQSLRVEKGDAGAPRACHSRWPRRTWAPRAINDSKLWSAFRALQQA
jgi:hypothetical protein